MRRFLLAALPALLCGSPGFADSPVQLDQAVFVERSGMGAARGNVRIIEPARRLFRGDRVVLVLDWEAARAQKGGFTVTSIVPPTLSFQRSSIGAQDVSVDGGRNWGRLGSLHIRAPEGIRLATPEDVTHLRWRIPADLASKGAGRITYSAIVR